MNLLNLLRHISLKRLRLQKAQTAMAGVGICLGVTAVVAIGIVNKSVLCSYEESINFVTGRAKIQVTGAQSGFPEAMLERVRAVAGVEYAVPVIETDGLLSRGKERSLVILGVDSLIDGQIRDYSLAGEGAEIPDPLLFIAKPDSILITRTLADREGIKIDRKIEVETVQGTRTFRVAGILNPEGPAKVMGGNLAVMDIYAAQMAFGKIGRIDRIDVSLFKGEELERAKQRIHAALPAGYRVETPAGRTRQIEVMLAKFQTAFNLIGFLVVFVGMYLIYNSVSISVTNRRREIGILRALGTTRSEIIRLFLGETLLMSVIASALGVVLGILSAKAVVGVFGEVVSGMYLRTAVSEIRITWQYPLLGMACGVSASLLAALFPVLTSSRVTPVSAIRSVPYLEEGFIKGRRLNLLSLALILLSPAILGLYKFSGTAAYFGNTAFLFSSQIFLLLGISLATPAFLKGFVWIFQRFLAPRLGPAGVIAALNLAKNINRNSVAVAAIFYGIAVFVSTAGYLHSIKESTISWLDAVIRADIIVSSGHPLSSTNARMIPMPAGLVKDIEGVPGVRSADPWRKIYMDYQGERVLLSTIDVARRMEYSPFLIVGGERKDMLRLLPGRDNVAISESFAGRFGVKPGDQISLATPAGVVRFGVAAVIVDYLYDGGTLIMDSHTFQRHWGDMLADTFSVLVKPGENISAVREEIGKRLGSGRKLFVLPSLEFKNEIRKALDQTFIFDYAVTVITLTIACFGIIVTLLASVMERTREIGVLRAIGMQKGQMAGVVVMESLVMGVAGGILGSGAGIIMGWFNLEGFFRAFFGTTQGDYYIPYTSVVWAILLSAGLSGLAGLYPARRAAKTNVVEALTYE